VYPKRYTRAVACACDGSKSCRHKRRFLGMNVGRIGLFHVICMFPTAKTMNEASSSRYKSCRFDTAPQATYAGGAAHTLVDLRGTDMVGIYVSAHWCPPCRTFTPQLVQLYKDIAAASKKFGVVFVSGDRDAKAFQE
jgi:thiol-disulfide isomerase/thioredoxin